MLVTVITPTYNRAHFLPETIESVLRQDYPNIEYIVLDDGSTDNTEELMEQYKTQLTYVKHANIGESKTVNKGFRLAQGDVILVVNSDDPLWSLSAISKAVAYFKDDAQVDLVYPDWVLISEKNDILQKMQLPFYHLENMLMEFNVALGPGIFIRKRVFEHSYYRNECLKYTGDLDISFRIVRQNRKIIHIPEFLASHRTHQDSESIKSQGNIMAKEIFRLCKESFKTTSQLSELCIQEKRKIYALAAYAAFMACGNQRINKLKWLILALAYNKFEDNICYSNGKIITLQLRQLLFALFKNKKVGS